MEDFFPGDFVEETDISVSASEIASAIGEHSFQPSEETLRKVWKRTDRPSFYFAMAQNFKKDVAKIISANYPFQATFPVQMDLESERGSRVFKAVLREVILNESARNIYREVMKFLDRQGFEDAKQTELLKEKGLVEDVKEATFKLCVNETKTVEKVVEDLLSKKGIDCEEVRKAVTSEITKTRGTKLEDNAVKTFAKENKIKVRQIPGKLFVKYMESQGVAWTLNGRVDGLTEKKVIEVKNRRNRFMCPMYDYIQIQAYLFLTGMREAVLLERLKGANKETELTYDKLFWEEYVTPMLGFFITRVRDKIEENNAQLQGKSSSPGQTKVTLGAAKVPDQSITGAKDNKQVNNPEDNAKTEHVKAEAPHVEEKGAMKADDISEESPNSKVKEVKELKCGDGRISPEKDITNSSNVVSSELNYQSRTENVNSAVSVGASQPTNELFSSRKRHSNDTTDNAIPSKSTHCQIA